MNEGGKKFDIEKIMHNACEYGFAVAVQNAFEKIFQRTKKEISEIIKIPGGKEILEEVSKRLEKEGVNITFTKKIMCSKCGHLIDGDDDNFHLGDKFYCLKCGGRKVLGML